MICCRRQIMIEKKQAEIEGRWEAFQTRWSLFQEENKRLSLQHQWGNQVQKAWDQVAKPLDSMGEFETLVNQMGEIQQRVSPRADKVAILVFCSDNGVVEEGFNQTEQKVTKIVTENMGEKTTSVCQMAKHIGADVIPINVGVNTTEKIRGVKNLSIAPGTKNFCKEPAMTKAQALEGIFIGIDEVRQCKEQGYEVIGIGEMGIGNTSTSSAVTASLLQVEAAKVTGPGAGLDDRRLALKIANIQKAIDKYQLYNQEPLEVLRCVGGFDLCALAGTLIGGCLYHIPIVADGFISGAAALVAERLCPGAKEAMIPSHVSKEPATTMVLEALGKNPVIHGNMALGEGTGAVMMISLLQLALCVYHQNRNFSDIALEPYQRFDSGKEEKE